jgi:hypothetical protein
MTYFTHPAPVWLRGVPPAATSDETLELIEAAGVEAKERSRRNFQLPFATLCHDAIHTP